MTIFVQDSDFYTFEKERRRFFKNLFTHFVQSEFTFDWLDNFLDLMAFSRNFLTIFCLLNWSCQNLMSSLN